MNNENEIVGWNGYTTYVDSKKKLMRLTLGYDGILKSDYEILSIVGLWFIAMCEGNGDDPVFAISQLQKLQKGGDH